MNIGKRNLFLLLLLLISPILSNAQFWLSEGTEWYYEVQPMSGCVSCIISFQHTKIVGDTNIQSRVCKVIERLNEPNLCDNMGVGFEYVYQSNDTLFWFNQTTEIFTVLYNFSANEGDSWDIQVSNCYFTVEVDEVDSILIDGNYRRHLHISDANGYFTGNIIEGIGHTSSFFPRDIYWECEGFGCDSDFIEGLRCYLRNDTLLYTRDSLPCDTSYLITGTPENLTQDFTIFPNPCKNYLKLKTYDNSSNKSVKFQYRILNNTGHVIEESSLSENQLIDIRNIPKGFYIFQFFNNDPYQPVINHKILKL